MEEKDFKIELINQETASPSNWREKTILIIEPDDINQALMKAFFKKKQGHLIFEKSTLKVLDLICSDISVDLVIIELFVDSVHSLEVIKQIRIINKNLPIIVQTSICLQHLSKQCYEVGCSEYIERPIRFSKLITMIDKHLISKE